MSVKSDNKLNMTTKWRRSHCYTLGLEAGAIYSQALIQVMKQDFL